MAVQEAEMGVAGGVPREQRPILSRMLFSALVKRPPFGRRGQVIPIRVATNSAGKPIKVGRLPMAIAIAP
jgi:hypothetical protein